MPRNKDGMDGLTTRQWLHNAWLFALSLYIISAPFEGYLVVPGLHGHSVVSLFQRILLIPLPLITFWAILKRRENRLLIPLGLMTAWIIWVLWTFAIFSPHTYYYLYYTWEQIAGFLLILSFWSLAPFQRFSRIVTIGTLVLYYLVTIVVSIWEIHTATHIGASREGGSHPSPIPTAFFYGPNHLGAAMALMLPFVAFLFLLRPSTWAKVASLILSLVGLYVLYKTGSRGGELAVAVEMVSLVILLPRKWKPYVMAGLGVTLIAVASGLWYVSHLPSSEPLPFALEKFRHLLHLLHPGLHPNPASHGPGSLGIRLALSASGLQALWHHPWGLGPRGAERYFLYYVHHKSPYNTYGVIDAHNMWLEIAMDYGWLGLSLYTLFYAFLLRGVYRLRRHSDLVVRYLSWAGFVSITGFIIGSLSPSSVMIGFNIMWIIYGLALIAIYQGTP